MRFWELWLALFAPINAIFALLLFAYTGSINVLIGSVIVSLLSLVILVFCVAIRVGKE